MRGNRVRRPLPWLPLCLLVLLLPAVWGCKMPSASTSSGSSGSAVDEAERTRKMEAKEAEIERKAEEIRNMEGTDQEKADAVSRLDAERRELVKMQEEGGSGNP